MTSTICLLPILAALVTANNFDQIKDAHWETINKKQQLLIESYWPNQADIDLLKDDEITSKASKDVNLINQFLKDNDFSIQLKDMQNPLAFYVASILKIALEWEKEGTKTVLNIDGKELSAVKFEIENEQNFKVYHNLDQSNNSIDILEIEAKNGDFVYMTQSPFAFNSSATQTLDFEILEHVELFNSMLSEKNLTYYDTAIFPTVDINQEVDIKWLEGIWAYDGAVAKYEIAQALQQTKFHMDERGAKVESAVAISCVKRCLPAPKKIFKIESSFYLWIMRPGMKTPIFAAYIDIGRRQVPQA